MNQVNLRGQKKESKHVSDNHIPQAEMDAIMGPEGGLPWHGKPFEDSTQGQNDDPMAITNAVNISPDEDIKSEEIPGGIKAEMKQSGAITVSLKDVRNRIGKDRQE